MPSQLFQQFDTLLQESVGTQEDNVEVTSYDVLIDQVYHEVENNFSYFAPKFDLLLSLAYQLLKNYQAEGTSLTLCSNLYEVFVLMVERKPALISKNPNRLSNIIQQLLEMLNMVDFICDEQWARPPEGYTEENDFSEDNCLTKQIMSYFDRIAQAYEYPKFNDFIIQFLPVWWQAAENDWKLNYSLLVVISQLGQKIEYPLTIKPFVDCAKLSLTNVHPKVRYGALQAIGQICDDMKPNFQQVYGEELLPLIINRTQDEVPRVQSHAMACLTNFLEDFEVQSYHIIQPYVDELINIAQNLCNNGISVVKETTISTISAFSTIDKFTPEQIERILGIINNLLTVPLHQQPEYNHVIDLTVECLSMLLYGQSSDKIHKYLAQSISVIKSLSPRLGASYIVNAWGRLCAKFNNFTDLSDIFPMILERIFMMIDSYDSEIKLAIEAINNTLDSFKYNIKPYMSQIFEFCKTSVSKLNIDDTDYRPLLYQIMISLVTKLKNQAPDPQYDSMANQTFTFFYDQVQKIVGESIHDGNHNCLEQAMQGLQQSIKYVSNLFTDENANKFASQIFNISTKISSLIQELYKDIDQMKQNLNQTEDDLEDDDCNQVMKLDQENIKKLYDARLMIPETFSSILSIIPLENAKSIIQNLYPHVSDYIQSHLPNEDIRYGLYFLCDFLKAVKYEGIQDYVQVYESTFCDYAASPCLEIRNCAAFALGELMSQIPVEKTDENLICKWLNILWNTLSLPLKDQSERKKYNFAKDNIVSALGKLIASKRQYFPNAINKQVHKKWLEYLPLNCDREQGDIQHQFILTLLDQTPETFISAKEDIFKLLMMFARYFSRRMNRTDERVLKNKTGTKKFLFKVREWPIFQENSEFLWNNLPANQKTILTQLMNAP